MSNKIIYGTLFILIILGLIVLFLTKSSQVVLALKIEQGIYKGDPVSVHQMTINPFRCIIKKMTIGVLSYEIPITQTKNIIEKRKEIPPSVLIEIENLKCVLYEPKYHRDTSHLVRYSSKNFDVKELPDEVALRSSAYATSPQDFSFWMDWRQTEMLEYLLNIKKVLCLNSADMVEVFYNPKNNIKGFLTFSRNKTDLEFIYYSTDEHTEGIIRFLVAGGNENTFEFVHAFIHSLSLKDCSQL